MRYIMVYIVLAAIATMFLNGCGKESSGANASNDRALDICVTPKHESGASVRDEPSEDSEEKEGVKLEYGRLYYVWDFKVDREMNFNWFKVGESSDSDSDILGWVHGGSVHPLKVAKAEETGPYPVPRGPFIVDSVRITTRTVKNLVSSDTISEKLIVEFFVSCTDSDVRFCLPVSYNTDALENIKTISPGQKIELNYSTESNISTGKQVQFNGYSYRTILGLTSDNVLMVEIETFVNSPSLDG